MIQSYQENIEVLASNSSNVIFQRDCIRTRSCNSCSGWLCHSEGSPIFKILDGGKYRVSFNANITSGVTGSVALALYKDGVIVPGTQMIQQVTVDGNYANISFDKIINVCCRGESTLTIGSVPTILTGATTPGTSTITEIPVIQNANLIIEKV